MRTTSYVRGAQHHLQRGLDRARRIGEEVGDPGQGLVGLSVKDVEDRADQERVAGLLPVAAPLQRAFRVDQDVGDILHVADLGLATAHLQQRVVGGGLRVGGVEQQHLPEPGPEAGGQGPVLALDVVDDG